jgi:hypothetical protein
MDRTLILAHREQTLGRIAEGDKLIAHQKELVSRCRDAGLATVRAGALLRALEAAQASHIACLARIERELVPPPNLLLD